MKISTKGRYALRLMVDIAMNGAKGPVSIKEAAGRQNISLKYLEQIIAVLVRAGYVRSVRGPQGGYYLVMEPGQYKVGDILRLTEGSMAPVDCLHDENSRCARQEECETLPIWKELDMAIQQVLDKYTLEDLVNWKKSRIVR